MSRCPLSDDDKKLLHDLAVEMDGLRVAVTALIQAQDSETKERLSRITEGVSRKHLLDPGPLSREIYGKVDKILLVFSDLVRRALRGDGTSG